MDRINLHTRNGTPTTVGDITIQPVSQSASWIGRRFGFVWNRPYAVKIEQDDTVYQMPIRDYSQVVQVVLWGLTALFVLVTISKSNSKRRNNHA